MGKKRTSGWRKRRRKVQLDQKQSWLREELTRVGCQWSGCDIHDWRILTFHHRDPDEKSWDFTQKNLVRTSLGRVKLERAKCDVYCFNHHVLVEWEVRDGENE